MMVKLLVIFACIVAASLGTSRVEVAKEIKQAEKEMKSYPTMIKEGLALTTKNFVDEAKTSSAVRCVKRLGKKLQAFIAQPLKTFLATWVPKFTQLQKQLAAAQTQTAINKVESNLSSVKSECSIAVMLLAEKIYYANNVTVLLADMALCVE